MSISLDTATAFLTPVRPATRSLPLLSSKAHTGEGAPVPPTGRSVASDYAYHMVIRGDQISHMTKVWNDGIALQQAGWV